MLISLVSQDDYLRFFRLFLITILGVGSTVGQEDLGEKKLISVLTAVFLVAER